MKVLRGIGTVILLAVLIGAIVLTLVTGLVRFMAMNPAFVKTFMTTEGYCAEMREKLSDDLDHVALLYGFEEGEVLKLVKDSAIRSYTNDMIDALYAAEETDTLSLPPFPTDEFADYARANTNFDEQGIRDFADDCAKAVEEDLAAINVDLIVGRFTALRSSGLVRWSLVLFAAGLLLSIVMIIFLKLLYAGESRRAGSVVVWGGCYAGVTLVFVPVLLLLVNDYVGKLKVMSAFRTILTGYLNTILYGWFFVLLTLEILTVLFSIIAIIRASKRR